jgi:hypothetical protein
LGKLVVNSNSQAYQDFADNRINHNTLKRELEWPHLRLRFLKWLNLLSSVLGIIGFIFLNLNLSLRIIIGIGIAISPLFINISRWGFDAIRVLIRRVQIYPRLQKDLCELQNKFSELKDSFFRLAMKETKIYEIISAKIQRGSLFIALRSDQKNPLLNGQKIIVIDKSDQTYMGQFEVVEDFSGGYYARGMKDIDPVWFGYIHERGESRMIPNVVGISIPIGGKNE